MPTLDKTALLPPLAKVPTQEGCKRFVDLLDLQLSAAFGLMTPYPITPTTLNEVISAGTAIGLWPSSSVPVTPTTLNQVIAAGSAIGLWP